MPKGKILMGKDPNKPGTGKPSPKGMVNPGKKRAVPMPKAKPGKPAPKGGTVIERKVQDNTMIKNGGPLSLAELRKRNRDGAKMQKAAPAPKRVTRRGGK